MTNTMKTEKVKKPSRIRITVRNDSTFLQQGVARGVTFLIAIAISILFLWMVGGNNPFQSLVYIFQGTFAPVAKGGLSITKLNAFFKNFVILLGIALALTPSYKMRFWNIGGQGQVLIGALACASCMIYLPGAFAGMLSQDATKDLANALIILISALSAMVAGGIWAYIPAFFKATWKTNETLFTLMMNYIAILLVELFTNIWRGQKSAMGLINQSSHIGWFYTIEATAGFDNKFITSSVFIPLILVAVLVATTYVYISYTKHGYEINVVGDSIRTAKYTGINVKHVIRRTVSLSGILCGLIGFFIVSNFDHTVSTLSDLGYGFTAVIVCWLSNFNSFAMVGYSALIVFLEKGAKNLADSGYSANLNEYSAQFIVFVIILGVMLGKFFMRYRIHYTFSRKHLVKSLTSGLVENTKAEENKTVKEAM